MTKFIYYKFLLLAENLRYYIELIAVAAIICRDSVLIWINRVTEA